MARALLYRTSYRMHGGLAKGYRRKFGYGSLPRFRLTAEERFLDALDLRGKVVYDVGAYIGIYSMFFARKCGAPENVVCFEPNPETFAQLCENLDLNGLGSLRRYNVAIGSEEGELALQVDPAFPARSTLDAGGAVMRVRDSSQSRRVRVARLDDLAEEAALERPKLVKLDVEGFEHHALLGMANILADTRPDLFIELHGREVARDVMRLLSDTHGYRIFHVESAAWVQPDRLPDLRLGHLYCEGEALG
jgi:FkbM family methyltransferase